MKQCQDCLYVLPTKEENTGECMLLDMIVELSKEHCTEFKLTRSVKQWQDEKSTVITVKRN